MCWRTGWRAERESTIFARMSANPSFSGKHCLHENELRRPEADLLRDGIYELRVSLQGIHHRILYFLHGTAGDVISHGLIKERVVSSKEIDRVVERKKRFEGDPRKHTYEEA
jgi:hypothetical protein